MQRAIFRRISLTITALCVIYFEPVTVTSLSKSLQRQFLDVLEGRMAVEPENTEAFRSLNNVSKACPRDAFFGSFNPEHMNAVNELKKILEGDGNSGSDVLQVAMDIRDRPEVNPTAWYYALSRVSYENFDLQGIGKPPPVQVIPDTFINSEVLRKARSQYDLPESEQICILLDETVGSENGVENALWYFREDIFVNSHHWFYHIAYPLSGNRQDRHGELFYYLHHSMLARYNADRFANSLTRVNAFRLTQGAILEEGFTTNLIFNVNSGQEWSDRKPFSVINNVGTIELSHARILEAVENGFLVAVHRNETQIPLKVYSGIDNLGNIIQASDYSVNSGFYGSVHNNGHIVIAFAHEPNEILGLFPGLMADTATAMRDVSFYRWHTYIDTLFNDYQRTLTPYQPKGGEFPLIWDGVKILGVEVLSSTNNESVLETFWNKKKIRLTRGLDFKNLDNTPSSATVNICAKHLDHQEFSYQFLIKKLGSVSTTKATIRIFLAPRFDENGLRFTIEEQRQFFFVLDTFTTELQVGENVIRRNSTESTLTIPISQATMELEPDEFTPDQRPFCGCGWPHHLLLPKGTPEGMVFDLFIMITNGDEDDVQNLSLEPQCRSAYLFCGIPNQMYPDARPMGYPFDRLPYNSDQSSNLDEFVRDIPNMLTQTIVIRHRNEFTFN